MSPNVMIEAGFVGEDAGTKRALVSFDVVVHVRMIDAVLLDSKPFAAYVTEKSVHFQVNTVDVRFQCAGFPES